MKFVYPEIQQVIDTECGLINTVIIENQNFLYELLSDIQSQIQGDIGKVVVSSENKILDISKWVEMHIQFVPFELNRRSLISKISSYLGKEAIKDDNYEETMKLLAQIEQHMLKLSFELEGNISFANINMLSMIKSSGIELLDDYDSLGEKLIDYMELVNFYDKSKLFIFVNLRSYINDQETFYFMDTVLKHGFHVIMIENHESLHLKNEKRLIIDGDLCEII